MRQTSLFAWTLFIALAGGCATTAVDTRPVSDSAVPAGATLSPQGFLTILEAPRSPWPVEPPPEPVFVADDLARLTSDPDPEVRRKAWENANGPADLQAELQRIFPLIRSGEPGSFVGLRMVRDPARAIEVWFERDAAATLAKYTADPRFRPRDGGIDLEEGMQINRLWWGRFDKARVPYDGGVNNIDGTIDFDILIAEAEYRRIVAGKSWEDDADPRLRLTFAAAQPPAFADPALEPLVRAFARQESATSIVLTSATHGVVTLVDGCFRLGGAKDPLVMFDRTAQLDRDGEGYLIIRAGGAVTRVGERAIWGGYPAPRESEADVKKLRRECGGGDLINVGAPQSQRLFSIPFPQWVADYARVKKITYREAWDTVIACMKRNERDERFLGARDGCIHQFNDR